MSGRSLAAGVVVEMADHRVPGCWDGTGSMAARPEEGASGSGSPTVVAVLPAKGKAALGRVGQKSR